VTGYVTHTIRPNDRPRFWPLAATMTFTGRYCTDHVYVIMLRHFGVRQAHSRKYRNLRDGIRQELRA
jgi:hypothetical protein